MSRHNRVRDEEADCRICKRRITRTGPVIYLKRPTAREMTNAITISETADCTSIAIFAHRASGIVSVGLNEHAFVKDT